MKRALALVGATMALTFTAVGSASAACVAPYCPAPTAVATGASAVGSGSATLNGTVNSNSGGPGSWTISLNGSVVASGSIADSSTTVPVSTHVTGLTAGSFYTYTVSVTNTGSTSTSSASFSTPGIVPPAEPPANPPSQGPPSNSQGNPPPFSGSQASETPTTTPPAPTSAEKKQASTDASDAVGGPVTFEAQVGSALVFGVDDAAPKKNGKVDVLALTADRGAKLETTGSVKLDNGKTLKLPKFTTTVGPDGQVVITVKLTKAQQKQLAKAGAGTISLQIQVTDQYGTHTKTVKVDVSAPKPKKSKKK